MSISIINSAPHNGFQVDPHSFSFNATGADALLIVVGSAGASVLAATYNGVSFTELWNAGDSGVAWNAGLMLLAPASGSNTISVDFAGLADTAVIAIALSGVEQSSVGSAHRTVSAGAGGGSGPPTRTATSVAGDFMFAGVTTWSTTITEGQTLIQEVQNVFGNGFCVSAEWTTAAGATTNMTWTAAGGGGGTFWYEGAVAIISATAQPVPPPHREPHQRPFNMAMGRR